MEMEECLLMLSGVVGLIFESQASSLFLWQATLVAIGAIPGAWLRLRVVNHLEPMLPRKHWGTFIVNLLAAFFLGLVTGLHSVEGQCNPGTEPSPIILLVGVGFFGSLSTFSTFAAELLAVLQLKKWSEFLLLSLGSIMGGLLVAGFGYSLGMSHA